MVGVTLSVGTFVSYAALSQFGLSTGSSAVEAGLQQTTAGIQVSLVYLTVAPSGACPPYQGLNEGTSATVALYNYGTGGFSPVQFIVNSTAYAGGYATLAPGGMNTYVLSLGSCAHPSGLTVVAVDAFGNEVQFAN